MMSNQITDNNSKYGTSNIGYAGDIAATLAWDLLVREKNAVLVDVRTEEEWKKVGVPVLSSIGKEPIFLSWRLLPTMGFNGSFIPTLTQKISDRNTPLLFLCRSGGRSAEAAQVMSQQGYVNCYNIGGGAEGIMDTNHHIKSADEINNGWKAAKLPWEQK
jgi:rhodanese-related sulfurtransferase